MRRADRRPGSAAYASKHARGVMRSFRLYWAAQAGDTDAARRLRRLLNNGR